MLYVNDSKATNVASALVGIASFPGGVHAILGGRSKGGGFAELAPAVAERCRAAYLIGETAAELHEALAPTGVPLRDCGDLERAVRAASAAARPATSCCSRPPARRSTSTPATSSAATTSGRSPRPS